MSVHLPWLFSPFRPLSRKPLTRRKWLRASHSPRLKPTTHSSCLPRRLKPSYLDCLYRPTSTDAVSLVDNVCFPPRCFLLPNYWTRGTTSHSMAESLRGQPPPAFRFAVALASSSSPLAQPSCGEASDGAYFYRRSAKVVQRSTLHRRFLLSATEERAGLRSDWSWWP